MNPRYLRILRPFILFIICVGILFCINTSSMAQYNIYYGHLHNHSNVSDGTGSPAYAYYYAKNVAGLDFFSLADHASAISSTEWNSIINAANSYNQDGVFVTFWGFEWSSSANYGHVAVINTPDYCTAYDSATNTFDELVGWLSTRDGVAFFNHPGREDDVGREFNHFSSVPSTKFVGIELFNKSNGFSEYYYNDGYYSNDGNKGFYDEALSRGWGIGASGGEDNHSGTWGTATDYRMAVLAETKTRTAIYNAIKARRFFSTLDKNISLSFVMNNKQMGSVINPGNYDCVIEAGDGDSEIFTVIQLIRNGSVIESWYPYETAPVITYNLTTNDGEYYYIKVTQADGDEAISSLISVVYDGTSDLDPPLPNPMTWSAPPQAVDSSSIIMTSTTASDQSGIEYYFTCTSGNGHDSGWQISPTYLDSGLQPNTQYTYRVKARDLSPNLNETSDSAPASATTPNTVNTPPAFNSDPIDEADATENVAYSSTLADDATDPDSGDVLTFSKVTGPLWLSVVPDGGLSGMPGASDTGLNVFNVRVEDTRGDFDEATLQIMVNDQGQACNYLTTGEATARGSVSGSYLDTHVSDDTYESITESIKACRWSILDHTWTFEISGNASVVFYVEAYHSSNSEGDDFIFSYSMDNVIFTDMFLVTKVADNNICQSYELPPYTSGAIYIRVEDTDRTKGNTSQEMIYIDKMFIRTAGTIQLPGAAFNPNPANTSTGVALNTLLSWSAGAGATLHDVYFGTQPGNLSPVSLGQTHTTYDPGLLNEDITYYWRIDERNSTGTTTGVEWYFTTTGGVCVPSTVLIFSIVTDTIKGNVSKYYGQAIVTVLDNCCAPVQGADVTGHFTGDFSSEPEKASTTDQNGEADFRTTTELKKSVFSFVVDCVNAEGLIWIH